MGPLDEEDKKKDEWKADPYIFKPQSSDLSDIFAFNDEENTEFEDETDEDETLTSIDGESFEEISDGEGRRVEVLTKPDGTRIETTYDAFGDEESIVIIEPGVTNKGFYKE